MNKKRIFTTVAAIIIFIATAVAQEVEQFTINGKTYYGTKAIPEELIGWYKYEKTKEEPFVEIKKDGTGRFQTHGVPAYPVEYWVETDEKGTVQKITSEENNNYQVVLILKYGNNGESGWRGEMKGTYTRIEATVAYSLGYVIILRERYKELK